MPYKKYSKFRNKPRKYNKTSRYLGYAGSAASTAVKALVIAQGIKKLMNVEFKFHDLGLSFTTIDDAGRFMQLTNVAQGDTDQTRDGAQIKITRINIKGWIAASPTSDNTIMRIILVQDKQTNQAAFTLADLLSLTVINDNIISPLNLDNKYRFRVLYNRVFTFNNTGNQTKSFEINKELNMRIRFDASTSTIADLTSNSLTLVLLSNKTINHPSITFLSRIRYVDN